MPLAHKLVLSDMYAGTTTKLLENDPNLLPVSNLEEHKSVGFQKSKQARLKRCWIVFVSFGG